MTTVSHEVSNRVRIIRPLIRNFKFVRIITPKFTHEKNRMGSEEKETGKSEARRAAWTFLVQVLFFVGFMILILSSGTRYLDPVRVLLRRCFNYISYGIGSFLIQPYCFRIHE